MTANPKYLKAHALVEYAVRTGRIKPQSCSVCGNARAEGHHRDYSKPLEVVWLCRKHHLAEHARTHCVHGHAFTEENVWRDKNGWRRCKACHRQDEKRRLRRLRLTVPAQLSTPERMKAKTRCPKGHEYTPSNTYHDPRGWRQCRVCRPTWGRR